MGAGTEFVCNSIAYQRRLVKSIYVIKSILLWEMLLKLGENAF